MSDPRRHLPSVDRLLQDPAIAELGAMAPRAVLVEAVRDVLARARDAGGQPPDDWPAAVRRALTRRTAHSLDRVVNATGIVLHTNLGRAPMARDAIDAIRAVAEGYSTLEFDLASGGRGSRHDHCAPLLAELTGAESALVVNNAAAALVLALNALAEGREVLISRGELIEIGGSFRIPDILAKSGAVLREVGTTNRTHLADYEGALSDRTGAILIVHRSNFEQSGFVTSPDPTALAALAHRHGVPCVYDVGSGLLADLEPWGLRGEPRVATAVAGGADVVLFSGDKLLGGPQAGCLVGTRAAMAACRRNPIARAVRADKMTLAGLEATLMLYRDPDAVRREVPVLRMLTLSPADLQRRAEALAAGCPGACAARTVAGSSGVGGGAFPGAALPTTLVSLDPGPRGADALCARLRAGRPPVIARVADGRVLLDPRTLAASDDEVIWRALAEATTR